MLTVDVATLTYSPLNKLAGRVPLHPSQRVWPASFAILAASCSTSSDVQFVGVTTWARSMLLYVGAMKTAVE